MTIKTRQLALRAGGGTLVQGLDWQVDQGECWSIIGRNGAGKSTLLRTLAGLRAPDAGTVEIDGTPVAAWKLEALARRRAYLAQSRHDAFAYSVIETVLSARHPYHGNRYWEGSDDHAAAMGALAAMEADHLAARDVRTLSGGERQRVAIAALAHQVQVMGLLARLCRQQHKTVIMIGHDLTLAHGISSHALLLTGDGRWYAGPVADAMQAARLSDTLGHPIETIEHGGRRIFIPRETNHD
jgi:iron complex transport system ATP-binding protein